MFQKKKEKKNGLGGGGGDGGKGVEEGVGGIKDLKKILGGRGVEGGGGGSSPAQSATDPPTGRQMKLTNPKSTTLCCRLQLSDTSFTRIAAKQEKQGEMTFDRLTDWAGRRRVGGRRGRGVGGLELHHWGRPGVGEWGGGGGGREGLRPIRQTLTHQTNSIERSAISCVFQPLSLLFSHC